MVTLYLVAGTRPEIIKLLPIYKYATQNSVEVKFIFSKQHFLKEMSEIFLEEFSIKYHEIKGDTPEERFNILKKTIENLEEGIIIVVGDTTTVLYTTLGYMYNLSLNVILAHIESGLHSKNPLSPEEKIRTIVESIADIRFAPSEFEKTILESRGIRNYVYVVGNPIYNALEEIVEKHKIKTTEKDFVLATLHRRSNINNRQKLKNFIKLLEMLSHHYVVKFVLHPTTVDFLNRFNLWEKLKGLNIELLSPTTYSSFLKLEAEAKFILTDSGGVQEESLYFKKPVVILRESTPRWIGVINRVHTLLPLKKINKNTVQHILEFVDEAKSRYKNFKNPYYNKECAKQIVEILQNIYGEIVSSKKNFDMSSQGLDHILSYLTKW